MNRLRLEEKRLNLADRKTRWFSGTECACIQVFTVLNLREDNLWICLKLGLKYEILHFSLALLLKYINKDTKLSTTTHLHAQKPLRPKIKTKFTYYKSLGPKIKDKLTCYKSLRLKYQRSVRHFYSPKVEKMTRTVMHSNVEEKREGKSCYRP